MKYEIVEQIFGKYIEATDDDGNVMIIPFADGNADYERYLKWLADQ
jgi:hypothetical protein